MAREEDSSIPATPNSGRKKDRKYYNSNKNRVEFRLPDNEFWIIESLAKFWFEKGYIKNPTVSEAARFSLNLHATDYMSQGKLVTKKLSRIIPIAYYDKLVKEWENEKEQRKLYKNASEVLAAVLADPSRIIDNTVNHSEQEGAKSCDAGSKAGYFCRHST